MEGANPIVFPALYDAVIIGGIVSPGKATVAGFARAYEWDVKKGKGSSGATITAQGEAPAKGTITLTLWEGGFGPDGRDHFAEWDAMRQLLAQPSGKTITAHDIFHPYLQDVGVTSIVVEELGTVEPKGGGLYEVAIKALEYKPPKKTGGTPGKSKPVTAKADPVLCVGGTSIVNGLPTGEPCEAPISPPVPAQDKQDAELEVLQAEAFP